MSRVAPLPAQGHSPAEGRRPATQAPHWAAFGVLAILAGILYTSLAHYGALDCSAWTAHLLTESLALQWSDALGNFIAYGLLGAAMAAASKHDPARPPIQSGRALLRTLLACGALSLSIEATQACLTERFSSATDWLLNVAGAGAGWALLRAWRRRGGLWAAGAASAPRRHVLMVLATLAWGVSATAPWRIQADLAGFIRGLAQTWQAMSSAPLDPWPLTGHGGEWLALGLAYASVLRRAQGAWLRVLAIALLVGTLQGLMPHGPQHAAEWGVTLLVAMPLIVMLPWAGPRVCAGAALLAALLATLAWQLEPGYGATQPFRWRVLLLHQDAVIGIQEAAWYGWLALTVVASGAAWPVSPYRWALVPPALLAGLAALQTQIPGRTPDLSAILFTLVSGVLAAGFLAAEPSHRRS